MKRFISILAILLIVVSSAFSNKTTVIVKGYKKAKVESIGLVKRAPAILPLEVYYDEELREVEVSADESLSPGAVYLYEENGNMIGYSSVLNCTLTIPAIVDGIVYIYIEGNSWDADSWVTIASDID